MEQKLKHNKKAKFIGFVATSVDGRISLNKKTPQDWTSKEDWEFFQDAISRVDAVVVGRKTYEVAKTRLEKRNTYVLTSRTKEPTQKGNIKFINPARTNLKLLFKGYKTVAILGGSVAYQTMLEEGLLDEIYITLEPLIFGRGVEMFVGAKKTTKLDLLSIKKLNKRGTLLLHYKIICIKS